MDPNRRHKFTLIGGFLALIYGAGIVQAGIELVDGNRPQFLDLFLNPPTVYNLRAFETELEDTSWFSKQLQPWVRYAMFLMLQDAGEKAVTGRDGWLFYKPDVRFLVEPWPARNTDPERESGPVDAILSYRDRLAARGIQLLVVPAPGKPSVYPEMLAPRAEAADPPVYQHTRETIEELRAAGVEVVDLFDVYGEITPEAGTANPLYLKQDTHWSPLGVQLAARAVANRLLDLRWVERGAETYSLESVRLSRRGDVLEMMDIPMLERHYPPEAVECAQVVRHGGGDPYQDDPEAEVLVLGDSFLRIYERDAPGSSGFISHLAHELQSPLTSIVSDGGASTLVRQQLQRRPELLKNKKVVVWEFVERDLRFGMEGWQDVPLPKVEGHAPTDS